MKINFKNLKRDTYSSVPSGDLFVRESDGELCFKTLCNAYSVRDGKIIYINDDTRIKKVKSITIELED